MIHSTRVVERIAELIKLAGVSSDATIEEMTDHYLARIEDAVEHGNSEQKAIRDTYQHIAKSDLQFIDKKEATRKKWIVGSIGVAMILLFLVSQCKNPAESEITTNPIASLEVPDGWPIDSDIDQISSGFGVRIHPISNTKRFHKGIDIKAKKGTPVLSTGDGTVIESGYSHTSGKYIVIRHNKQYSTKYLHLSKIDVAESQILKKGDPIGLVGNSGISLSPHLHYEVIKDETVVDPMDVIAP